MSPEQLASDFEGGVRGRLMTRSERAALATGQWAWEGSILGRGLGDSMLSYGRVRIMGEYPGMLVYEYETTWDWAYTMTRAVRSDA